MVKKSILNTKGLDNLTSKVNNVLSGKTRKSIKAGMFKAPKHLRRK